MTKRYLFDNEEWVNDFIYARAPHTRANAKYPSHSQGVLKNQFNPEINEEDYVSLISKKVYGSGTEINVTCSFTGTGAPCLVFTNDLSEGEDFPEYGLHFEVCIYSGGVNVWHIIRFPERTHRPIKPTKIFFDKWPVPEEGVSCSVRIEKGRIRIAIEGREYIVENPDIPESFRVGFTACEGPCGFSEFGIKEA